MRILVIGGTGHIGSYLVPRLVLAGNDVSVVARNPKPQYGDQRIAWGEVKWIVADRRIEEEDGSWQKRMKTVEVDVVIDLLCFTSEQNRMMVEAFKGRVDHFLHCGTIWAYGPATRSPFVEDYPRKPITEYGRLKAAIEVDLLSEYRRKGFPATIVHPGHVSGRWWLPIDPQGSRNGVRVYEDLALGRTVYLPDTGLATLHHVHADDVAQVFELAIKHRQVALGESFSAVAPYAITLVGCCESVASLFGKEPVFKFVPLEKLGQFLGEKAAEMTKSHVMHSPCCSIEKARKMLGYQPRYNTEQIYRECIEHLLESGQLEVGLRKDFSR